MKTWTEKLNGAKNPQKKRLDKPFAGMPAGSIMYIPTPKEIDDYIRAVPRGKIISVKEMRNDLARKNGAEFMCPLTAGIFLRIVAEASYENMNLLPSSEPTPFWRIIEPSSPLAGKLSFDTNFIEQKRREEASN